MLVSMRDQIDGRTLRAVAKRLEERYRAAIEERGGDLSVSAGKASDLRMRTKSLELHAGVQWAASRIYDHVHVEVARRPWFSRRWDEVRVSGRSRREMETELAEWTRRSDASDQLAGDHLSSSATLDTTGDLPETPPSRSADNAPSA
jgi:hypothetical protein